MRILVVEDTVRLAETIAEALEHSGYDVDVVHDGRDGYEYAASEIYDIVILDLMLPGMDGYEVLRKLRQERMNVPVLILSAKSQLQDKIDGFTEGADDYVTKPFEMEELLFRIRAILHRRQGIGGNMLVFGDLGLDVGKSVMRNEHAQKKLQLSKKELQILERFLCNPGRILSKEELTEKVWGYESCAEYNQVEVYISFLRKKLAFLQVHVKIRTVRGIGYVLEEV